MNIILTPTFETKRLILKQISLSDVKSYARYFIDYDVIRFLSHIVPWPYPENGVENFIESYLLPKQGKGFWTWGIFLKSNPKELIGSIDLWVEGILEHRGFWLGKKFWNRGIMTEAMNPILDFAFETVDFEEIIFSNAVGNIASRKVKEKTGCELYDIKPAKFVDKSFTQQEL